MVQLCLRSGGEEGRARDVSGWILKFELVEGPPDRSSISDVAVGAFRHARVEDGKHFTIASENEVRYFYHRRPSPGIEVQEGSLLPWHLS